MNSSSTTGGATRPRTAPRGLFSVRGRIIPGFGLLVLILALVAGGSAWQVRAHRSNINEMESHSRTATLLQDAEAQAGVAALTLQRYVIAENAALPPGVQLASEVQLYASAG